MIAGCWTISLVLLNVLMQFSHQYAISPEMEHYNQHIFQDNGPAEITVLPQDCIEVCNDYECLFLCPQPTRGVKRCTTQVKSNKKSCCQNSNKEPTNTETMKTPGKWLWQQAREQYLGIKKELENEILNKRNSIFRILNPIVNGENNYNKGLLQKAAPKNVKPRENSGYQPCKLTINKNLPNSSKNGSTYTSALGRVKDVSDETNIPLQVKLSDEIKKKTIGFFADSTISGPKNVPVMLPSDTKSDPEKEKGKLQGPRVESIPGLRTKHRDPESHKWPTNASGEELKSGIIEKSELLNGSINDTVSDELHKIDFKNQPTLQKIVCNGVCSSRFGDENYVEERSYPDPTPKSSDPRNNHFTEGGVFDGNGNNIADNTENNSLIHSIYSNPENGVGVLKRENQVLSYNNQDVQLSHFPHKTPPTIRDLFNNFSAHQPALRNDENNKPIVFKTPAHWASVERKVPSDTQVIGEGVDTPETDGLGRDNKSITRLTNSTTYGENHTSTEGIEGFEVEMPKYNVTDASTLHTPENDENLLRFVKTDVLHLKPSMTLFDTETPNDNFVEEDHSKNPSSSNHSGDEDITKRPDYPIQLPRSTFRVPSYTSMDGEKQQTSGYTVTDVNNIRGQNSDDKAFQYSGIGTMKATLDPSTQSDNYMQVVGSPSSNHDEHSNTAQITATSASSTTLDRNYTIRDDKVIEMSPYEVANVGNLSSRTIFGNLSRYSMKIPSDSLVQSLSPENYSSDYNGHKMFSSNKSEEDKFNYLLDKGTVDYTSEIAMAFTESNAFAQPLSLHEATYGKYNHAEIANKNETNYIESDVLPLQTLETPFSTRIPLGTGNLMPDGLTEKPFSFEYNADETLAPNKLEKELLTPLDNYLDGHDMKGYHGNQNRLLPKSDRKEQLNENVDCKANHKEFLTKRSDSIIHSAENKQVSDISHINETNQNNIETYHINVTDSSLLNETSVPVLSYHREKNDPSTDKLFLNSKSNKKENPYFDKLNHQMASPVEKNLSVNKTGYLELTNVFTGQSGMVDDQLYPQIQIPKENFDLNLNNISKKHVEMAKNPVMISTKQNYSETLTELEDFLEPNIADKRNLNGIIYNEINNMKQHDIVLKKREEEMSGEDYGYGNPIKRNSDFYDEKAGIGVFDHNVKFPYNPLIILFARPYPVYTCNNETMYDDFIGGGRNFGEPYESKERLFGFSPDQPFHKNCDHGEEDQMGQFGPNVPNFYLPYDPAIPPGGLHNNIDPPEFATDGKYFRSLQQSDSVRDNDPKITDGKQSQDIVNETSLSNEETRKSIPGEMPEMYKASPATLKANNPETERKEEKDIDTLDYEFVDGQFVKVRRENTNADTEILLLKTGDDSSPRFTALETPTQLDSNLVQASLDGTTDAPYMGGRQNAFANRNQTDLSKPGTLLLDVEENLRKPVLTDDTEKSVYIDKNTYSHNKSTKEYDSTWPSFADLLNQLNNTKIHHYKHHHKHRWWLHISHHLEKMKAKVRLKTTDITKLQEERIQNFVFRKEKVNDKTIPILVISEKKQNKQEEHKSENLVQTEYAPRKIRHEA